MEVEFNGVSLKELEKEWKDEGLTPDHGSVLMDLIIQECQTYSDPNDFLYQEGHWDTLKEYLDTNTVDIIDEVYLSQDGDHDLRFDDLKVGETSTFEGVTMWLKDSTKVDVDPDDIILVLKGKQFKGISIQGNPSISPDIEYFLSPFSFKVTRISGRYKYIEAI